MSTKSKAKNKVHPKKNLKGLSRTLGFWLPKRTFFRRLVLGVMAIVLLATSGTYGVAQWYIHKHKSQPIQIGATFVPSYARYFGLDPQETLQEMITDLKLQELRLVSYWDVSEKTQGTYDFSELDWQFKMAEASNVKVSLAIGLRQPRWPECHMPKWAENMPMTEWEPKLTSYMGAVIERYKNSPVLESYQLENEFFLDVFGICPDFSRDRLIRETNFVRAADPNHKLIISRSNNALGLPVGKPTPDEFGISVYKRVWDKNVTKRYYEYPFPPWFYAGLAGGGEILTGKDMRIHELQTESWLPDTGEFAMNDLASIPEQNKSLNAERLRDRIRYGEATGMRSIGLWGVEWWYWRKTVANDPSLWDTAKDEIAKIKAENSSK